jgi:hypothetical protein
MSDRIAEDRAIVEAATPGPWAWEEYGEKENCFHVGVAFDKNEQQLSGHVETEHCEDTEADGPIFVEDVIWGTPIGSMEGATVNYADAAFIAAARNRWPLYLALAEAVRRQLIVSGGGLSPNVHDALAAIQADPQ